MFLEQGADTSWISKDIRNPGLFTVVTYQALHAAMVDILNEEDEVQGEEEEVKEEIKAPKVPITKSPLLSKLKGYGIGTLILDEAHHLRTEWWRALMAAKDALQDANIVALTATPPYDVERAEWSRYEKLCGPIDAEISVPELVKTGDLCPHQDYLFMSWPTEFEAKKLNQLRRDVRDFVVNLEQDQELHLLLKGHPWVQDTQGNLEELLEQPELFLSMLIILNQAGTPPSDYACAILGLEPEKLPSLNNERLEEFLNLVLYKILV